MLPIVITESHGNTNKQTASRAGRAVLDEVHQSLDNVLSNVLSKQHLLLEPSHPRTFPLSEQQQLCLRSP